MTFENLPPGNYKLCVQKELDKKEDCYVFEIKEPAEFEVATRSAGKSRKQVQIAIKGGTKPYNIYLNGNKVAHTDQEHITLNTTQGDYLEVVSSGSCAFSYAEMVNQGINVEVSPNPTHGPITIYADGDDLQNNHEVPIKIYSPTGTLVLTKYVIPTDGFISMDISELSSGFYLMKIGDKNSKTFKILKQ